MSETKSLTLDEAKAEIREYRKALASGPSWARTLKAQAEALGTALSILARVEQPSEEDRAVLWLIREWQWTISKNTRGWLKVEWAEGDYVVRLISPADEARKLGWGG